MITIRQNRDTYSKHHDMIRWCLDNIGFSAMEKKYLCDDRPFYHAHAFGYLILTFYNEFDAFRFKMEWGGEKIHPGEEIEKYDSREEVVEEQAQAISRQIDTELSEILSAMSAKLNEKSVDK